MLTFYLLGVTKRLQSRNQESQRKKKTVETHISGERVRYFTDDDRYSLQEMVCAITSVNI